MNVEQALQRSGELDQAFASFENEAAALGVTMSDATIATLRRFAHRLLDANDTMDLTAIVAPREVVIKHFLDSVTILPHLPQDVHTLVDVGTGAGFPGLVLAIVRPDVRVCLVESIAKKALFLERVIDDLELQNVAVVCARAEDAGRHPDMRETFDVAVARAVAETATLAEYLAPLIRVGGACLMQKSDVALPEVRDGATAIEAVGMSLRRIEQVHVAALGEVSPDAAITLANRSLIILEKTAATPDAYPRRVGVPSKRPVR